VSASHAQDTNQVTGSCCGTSVGAQATSKSLRQQPVTWFVHMVEFQGRVGTPDMERGPTGRQDSGSGGRPASRCTSC
jgi:hypothetical protein